MEMGAVLLVLNLVALWLLYEKAGEKGWKALIPYYSTYICCRLSGRLGLFWAELAVSVVLQLTMAAVAIFSGSLLLDFSYTNGYWDYDFSLGRLQGVGVLLFAVLVLVIAMVVLRILINLRFVECFTDQTGIKVLAGIGSFPVFHLLLVIARCILAFGQDFRYTDPREWDGLDMDD